MATIDSLKELVTALSNGTIADRWNALFSHNACVTDVQTTNDERGQTDDT